MALLAPEGYGLTAGQSGEEGKLESEGMERADPAVPRVMRRCGPSKSFHPKKTTFAFDLGRCRDESEGC